MACVDAHHMAIVVQCVMPAISQEGVKEGQAQCVLCGNIVG